MQECQGSDLGFSQEGRHLKSWRPFLPGIVRAPAHSLFQSSTVNRFTRRNTQSRVTSVASAARANAAIVMSRLPPVLREARLRNEVGHESILRR